MTKKEFILTLKEALEIEDKEITFETELNKLPEFDSLAFLTIIALVDEWFNKKIIADELKTVTTVNSLINMIGEDKFE